MYIGSRDVEGYIYIYMSIGLHRGCISILARFM